MGEIFKSEDLKDEEDLEKKAGKLAKELGENPKKVEKDLKRRPERRQNRNKER